MAFYRGQKVVCVNDVYRHHSWHLVRNRPVQGAVYIIREIASGWFDDGEDGLRLEEVKNEPRRWHGGDVSEVAFALFRFRPVVERKTDIGFAHEILRKVTRRQGADA